MNDESDDPDRAGGDGRRGREREELQASGWRSRIAPWLASFGVIWYFGYGMVRCAQEGLWRPRGWDAALELVPALLSWAIAGYILMREGGGK